MISKLYSQLSDIKSSADQDRIALKMAKASASRDYSRPQSFH